MKRAKNQPVTEALVVYAGIYAKAYTVADAGTLLPQHSHAHSHLTALTTGSVRVWCGGTRLGDFNAPALIKIRECTLHQFLTLTPGVGLICIHAVGEADDVAIHADGSLELED